MKIELSFEKKQYVLEYNRQSVRMMESQGFVLDEITAKPMTMIPLLFSGAFIKNHKGVKRSVVDAIYDGIGDKNAIMDALLEMYIDTLSTLTDTSESGNVDWTLLK